MSVAIRPKYILPVGDSDMAKDAPRSWRVFFLCPLCNKHQDFVKEFVANDTSMLKTKCINCAKDVDLPAFE